MIKQADAYAARCEVCHMKGPLGGDRPEALSLAKGNGWKIGRQRLIHEKTTTCPTCAEDAKGAKK